MNLKRLKEQRAALQTEMQALLDAAEAEERAMTDEESGKFDELEKKIKDIDRTIEVAERAHKLDIPADPEPTNESEDRAEAEERAFADYIRGVVSEERTQKMTATDNTAVIPTSIANKIIEKVEDICPIYQLADKIVAGGNLTIPYYDETTEKITMDYADEFTELTSTSGKFASINLSGFLAGVLTKVSKSLVNNAQFDIVNYVIDKMALSVARWIEKELLLGDVSKIKGISEAKQVVTTAEQKKITPDELIDLQEMIPDVYQPDCIWIMNKATRTYIRKFKDSDGDYILNKDMTAKWGYTLFGRPVYCSDQLKGVDKAESTNPVIVYGDMKGLVVKTAENMNIEVLRERFATEHAIGVVGWLEMDAKIQNEQMIAVMKPAGE